jgi:hypothetical protein
VATERPSLLDDADLAAIGSKSERSGAEPDRTNMMKLGLAAVLLAAAGIAISYPYWKPDGSVRMKETTAAELTPELEAEFKRQERDLEVALKQGTTGTE